MADTTPRGGLGHVAEDVDVRLAACRDELEEAYELVYTNYVQRGYIQEHSGGIRVTVFNAFPTTRTFVAVLDDQVIATVSLVEDTPAGLPMDEIYKRELDALREQGRKISEVTMLADRRRLIRRALAMLLMLMKRVFDYAALVQHADDLCITINPRHESYYERCLLFKPLGPLRSYPSVRENPALAKRLNIEEAVKECVGNEELQEQFLRNRTPMSMLNSGYRMTRDDLHYFLVERTTVLRDAPNATVDYLKQYYPDCPWDDWRRE